MAILEKGKFLLASQYLQAASNLLDSMCEKGNPNFCISDTEISDSEFHETIRHSSCCVILPTLFCFYQGLELLMKGFIYIKDVKKKQTHKLGEILNEFRKYYANEVDIYNLLHKHINQQMTFITEYMKDSNIQNADMLYNSLRYDDDKSLNVNYLKLEYYPNHSFLEQIKVIRNDIDSLLKLSVSCFRKLEDEYK